MNSPDWDNFMEHFTNENDNGYAQCESSESLNV